LSPKDTNDFNTGPCPARSLAESRTFRSADSILDSRKKIRNERKVFVSIPATYHDGTKAPILVIHDGRGRLNEAKKHWNI